MKDFFSHFDAIYCINLDHRTDRWEFVQQEFEKVGIRERVVRFSAIETPSQGAVGCFLSHRAIIQIAQDNKWENVLVFEDDIEFINIDSLNNIHKLPKKWDLLYLGGSFTPVDFPFLQKSGDFFRGVGIRCTHSIAYHQNIYSTLLKMPIDLVDVQRFIFLYDAIDAYLSRFIQQENTTFFTFLCKQHDGISDITKQQMNRLDSMEKSFFYIASFSKTHIFYWRILRPLLRQYWRALIVFRKYSDSFLVKISLKYLRRCKYVYKKLFKY